MKYNEQKFAKFIGGTGFFAIVACCVLIIGAATWFAVSRVNKTEPEVQPSPKTESYSSDGGSYNDIGDIGEDISSAASDIADEVTNSVSNEPYSESSQTELQETKVLSFISPVEGEISKNYSSTELQYSATYGDMRLHIGVDIACEKGASVKAMEEGRVISVEENASLGTVITVDHGNGITVRYCGVENITVAAEDRLAKGEVIGAVGTVPCECADQSHIHIEMYEKGKSIAPKIK